MTRRTPTLPLLAPDDPSVSPTPAERWQQLFGTSAPARSTALVEAAVAWKEQVLASGDVAPLVLADLRILAHQLRTARLDRQGAAAPSPSDALCTTSPDAISCTMHDPDQEPSGSGADRAGCTSSPAPIPRTTRRSEGTSRAARPRPAPAPLLPASSQLAVGTRLVKLHQGVTHVVEVTGDGMRYGGQLFASLSAVARHITGTHWNGLLFFGLRRRKTYPRSSARG